MGINHPTHTPGAPAGQVCQDWVGDEWFITPRWTTAELELREHTDCGEVTFGNTSVMPYSLCVIEL